MNDLPIMYSRHEAALSLSISVRKLDYLISSGRLAVIRIDGKTLLAHTELLSFIEAHTVRATRKQNVKQVSAGPA